MRATKRGSANIAARSERALDHHGAGPHYLETETALPVRIDVHCRRQSRSEVLPIVARSTSLRSRLPPVSASEGRAPLPSSRAVLFRRVLCARRYHERRSRRTSPARTLAGSLRASCIDRHWHDDGNYYNFYFPNYSYLLNLMLRRIPDKIRPPELYAGMVARARSLLATTNQRSDEWHAAMWDIIRIERRPADIDAYLKVIRLLIWRDVTFY